MNILNLSYRLLIKTLLNKYLIEAFDFIDLLLKNGADEHINNIYGQKYLEYQ